MTNNPYPELTTLTLNTAPDILLRLVAAEPTRLDPSAQPNPTQTFALPLLPEEITELFPDYPREGFTMNTLDIYQDRTDNLVRSQGTKFSTFGVAGDGPMEQLRWGPQGLPGGLVGNQLIEK